MMQNIALKLEYYQLQDTRYFIVLLCIQLYTYKTFHAKSIQKHNIHKYTIQTQQLQTV